MGLISDTQFIGISDRLAKQACNVEDAVLVNQSGLGYYVRVHDGLCSEKPGVGDFPIEIDLIQAGNTTDVNMKFSTAAGPLFSTMINALNNHVVSRGSDDGVTSMDDYLNGSGINVHEKYNLAYEAIVGASLNAVNVYRDDEIHMGQISITSSGVGTFTDGEALGTGTGSFARDTGPTSTPNSAEQNVQWCAPSGIGPTSDVIVNIVGTNEQGNTVSQQVTVPIGTVSGTCATVTPLGFKLLDVTAIQFAGGGLGDIVTVRSVVERNIGL